MGRRIIAGKDISQGCRLCHEGSWLCVYVTKRCNRDCCFCSQEKPKHRGQGGKSDDPIRAYVSDKIRFGDVDEVVRYLMYWKIKGLGISGGEPLLVFDRVLRLISLAKKKIPEIYVWLYTNGDLATEQKLRRLKKAGLDEIRFDLAARDYELSPLRAAEGIIRNVAVETPAIPKDRKKLIAAIKELRQIGVRYLNLHELMVTDENRMRLKEAGHTGKKGGGGDAGEDGETGKAVKVAAESLRLAREIAAGERKRGGLMVNVCPTRYKQCEQTKNMIMHMRAISRELSQ